MNRGSLSVSGACRRLSDAFCISIAELRFQAGEVTALIGPTGAGKTTLLRLLTGLDLPDRGVIELDGRQLVRDAPLSLCREISMVHQRPILLNGSVEANVEYGLRARRRSSSSLVKEVLSRLGLESLVKRDVRSLSGGQVQLVALARALVLEPKVLLLDEPTSNLDPAYVATIETAIDDIQRARGMTVVWATHNLFQARRVSQTVVFLLNGQVVEVAESQAFFTKPCDARTADFIQGKLLC
jgi:tungstate transport system ATP-binding protein